jgi:hypothetical protein
MGGMRGSLTNGQWTRCIETGLQKQVFKASASKGDESVRVYQLEIKSAKRFYGTGQ